MVHKKASDKIDALFAHEAWEDARIILEQEREKAPNDHWVITQLGVTFYEERRYEEALQLFLASQKIVPDCPLTLWNLAGVLDALGKATNAMPIYTWLLNVNSSSDPCWEGKEWLDHLKADCVYRIAVCFQHLRKKPEAEHCYRQYLDLLSIGVQGTYSIEDVKRQLRDVYGKGRTREIKSKVRKAVSATVEMSGIGTCKGRQRHSLNFDIRQLLPGRLTSNKK